MNPTHSNVPPFRRVSQREVHPFVQTIANPVRITRRLLRRLRGTEILHVLHIRKTGGTAIKHALKDVPKAGRFQSPNELATGCTGRMTNIGGWLERP